MTPLNSPTKGIIGIHMYLVICKKLFHHFKMAPINSPKKGMTHIHI